MKNKAEIFKDAKKLSVYALYGAGLFFAIALIYVSINPNKKAQSSDSNAQKISQKTEVKEVKSAEKIQIYEFHSTNRCYSCVTMGEYVRATVEEFFQPELRSGKIEFKEINVDLSENKELAKKFQAAGTSLFINSIIDGEDNIKEETQAWRLLGNQQAFSDYLSKKVNSLF